MHASLSGQITIPEGTGIDWVNVPTNGIAEIKVYTSAGTITITEDVELNELRILTYKPGSGEPPECVYAQALR